MSEHGTEYALAGGNVAAAGPGRPGTAGARVRARTGTQPWARLHAEGHGTYWAACADYIDRHQATWRQFLR